MKYTILILNFCKSIVHVVFAEIVEELTRATSITLLSAHVLYLVYLISKHSCVPAYSLSVFSGFNRPGYSSWLSHIVWILRNVSIFILVNLRFVHCWTSIAR